MLLENWIQFPTAIFSTKSKLHTGRKKNTSPFIVFMEVLYFTVYRVDSRLTNSGLKFC